jgi:hypothetical protein
VFDRTAPPASFRVSEHSRAPGVTAIAQTTEAFRTAASATLRELQAISASPAFEEPRLDLDTVRVGVVEALNPSRTIEAATLERVILPGALAWEPRDRLDPVLIGPEFSLATAEVLQRLSPQWLLPGADGFSPNSVGLLETNRQFVEAFLVGANDEMARELRWREFPANMQRTFLQHFWPGTHPAAPTPDIPPIDTWEPASGLGEHGAGISQELVLVIRGDLVHRYPTIEVYATRAAWTDSGRELGTEERRPRFEGRIGRDIAYFGLPLTSEAARGDSVERGVGDPGWFLVLAERPGEARFGLSISGPEGAPTRWVDLAWSHLPENARLGDYIDLDADAPDTRRIDDDSLVWHADRGLGPQGATASHLAAVTMRAPARIAFHASDLLGEHRA